MAKKATKSKTSVKKKAVKNLATKTATPKQARKASPKIATKTTPKATPKVASDLAHKKVTAEIVAHDEDTNELEIAPEQTDDQDDGEISGELVVRTDEAFQDVPHDERGLAVADPVSLYLAEVRKYPLLTREQESELAKKYFESKDPKLAQALVTANLRFVVKVAAEYSKFGARLIDLIQEGNVGLMHAVKEFNPYKGVRLITYAVWWIRGYIQEYLMRQYSMVRIGTTQNQRKLFYRLQKEKKLLDEMGENFDYKQIGERLGVSAEEVEDMSKRLRNKDLSLDQPIDVESRSTLGDLQTKSTAIALDDELANAELIQLLREKIEEIRPELNKREIILLEERLLADDPLTLQEIGEKYGITREAVRQAEVRLLTKIKNKLPKI